MSYLYSFQETAKCIVGLVVQNLLADTLLFYKNGRALPS